MVCKVDISDSSIILSADLLQGVFEQLYHVELEAKAITLFIEHEVFCCHVFSHTGDLVTCKGNLERVIASSDCLQVPLALLDADQTLTISNNRQEY